jgi:hypothetical protein
MEDPIVLHGASFSKNQNQQRFDDSSTGSLGDEDGSAGDV